MLIFASSPGPGPRRSVSAAVLDPSSVPATAAAVSVQSPNGPLFSSLVDCSPFSKMPKEAALVQGLQLSVYTPVDL